MEEANYEYEALIAGEPVATNTILRQQEYWTLLSGGAGQLYGNHYIWPFLSGWQTHLDTPGALEMRYLTALFTPRAWYNLVPDTNHVVVTAGYGTYSSSGYVSANSYITAASTPDGTLAIAYMPTVRTITVDLAKFGGAVRRAGTIRAVGITLGSPARLSRTRARKILRQPGIMRMETEAGCW